jgi:hypothetical protein
MSELKSSMPENRIPKPPEFAAAENLSPEFFAILAKLGLEILIVRFQSANDSPIWEHDGIERELERELQFIKAGQFDSSYFPLGMQWHFFHVPAKRLGKAAQQVKSALAARGLLEISTIYHAETPREWRVWYPATAEVLRTDADVDDETEA